MTRRRIWSLVAFGVLVAVLLGASLYLRNFLFRQVEKKIHSVVEYSSLKLHLFPPSAVLRDVRTVSTPFSFTAEEILVELPLSSLLKSEKPLVVFINRPVLRVRPVPAASEEEEKSLSRS